MTESRQVRRARERAAADQPRLYDTHPLGNRALRHRRIQLARIERRPDTRSGRRRFAQHVMRTIFELAELRARAVTAVSAASTAQLEIRAPVLG